VQSFEQFPEVQPTPSQMASESKGGDDLDVGGGAAAFAAPLGPPSDPDSTPQALAYQGRLHALQVALAGKGDRQANAITEQDTDGRSLLHWAAAGGKQEALSYLLHTAGALAADALNRRDEGGLTPLASAAASGSTACITLLLDHGADANVASKGGQLPLMYHKGRVPVIAALLPATKDINMQDKAGATALHRAAGPGHLGAVQALLAAGARIDLQDR
jgi:hypothetical protein